MSGPDRELIEWTASAHIGDLLPDGYRHMYGTQQLIGRLVELGVMPEPPAGTMIADLVTPARQAATEWLEKHPD